ncbi:MAG: hypothetical protein U0P30_01050 [Vicinamibacterales bacterium]
MPFSSPTLAPHAATIAGIRAEMNIAARAGAPGCVAVIAVAIAGAWGLLRVSDWNPDWWHEPATLAALAGYPVALWITWKIGASFAAPETTRAEQAWARLVDEIMPAVMASLRPGARFDARAEAPREYLEHSRLSRWALMTSGNRLQWSTDDLALECYAIHCVTRDDSASVDRHFVGLLARAPLRELDHDFHVVVKSRRQFDQQVPAPAESAAITDFDLDPDYRVITNWEPFARAVLTSDVQRALRAVAADDPVTHVSVAHGAVWVGVEDERHWFVDFPRFSFTFIDSLNDAHLAALAARLDRIDALAGLLARAVRAQASGTR